MLNIICLVDSPMDLALIIPNISPGNDSRLRTHILSAFYSSNGIIFEGEWVFDKEATGDLLYRDGSRYTGQVSAGKPHGRGRETNKFNDVYDGSFIHGVREGEGVESLASGDVYEGNFVSNKRNGYGIYKR